MSLSDEVAKLKRRVRQLKRSRQKWKGRSAAKQDHIRYLRVKSRDLALSRDHWRRLAADQLPPTHEVALPQGLPFPLSAQELPLGEP